MAIKNIGVLAFASAAFAAGHHQHNRLHARGTGSAAAPAIPTGLPACWGSCFQKAPAVSGPADLCDNTEVSDCIKVACATADVASYEAWLAKQCNSDAPYPSGGNNSTAVGPTATGGYSSVPGAGYSTSVCTETSTLIYQTTTAYSTYLITHTLSASGSAGTGSASAPGGYGSASAPGGYGDASSDVSVGPATESAPAPGGYGSGAPGAPSGAPSGTPNSPVGGEGDDECSEVTVTTTERTTVTVTAGEGGAPGPSSYAAPSSPAGGEAPTSYAAPSSPAAAPSSPAAAPSSYAAPSSEGSDSAPSSYVSEAAAPSSWAAPSSYAAPSSEASAPSSYAPASSSSASSPEQSSPPTYNGSGFRGKRGIAYNVTSMAIPALTEASKIGWASNWVPDSDGFEGEGITYIPCLNKDHPDFTLTWADKAEAAIAAGLPYLFGPNEPDIGSQANMSPQVAKVFWETYMEPYAGRIGLVAPSVSSGVGAGLGQAWLDDFFNECASCTFDAVNQHWYNSDGNFVQNFKDTVNGAAKYGKPVFVGEFGAIGSDEEISSFLNEVMPFMDGNENVVGYAYFMAYEGLLINGESLTPYGETYCNA